MHAFVFHPLSRALAALTVTAAMALPAVAQKQHAHVHGKLSLDVAVDDKTITVSLHSPLDNFLGFERAPRTDEERKQVSEVQAKLKAADQLLQPDPAAGCTLGKVVLHAPVLGWGDAAHSHDHAHDHDDDEEHDHDHNHDHGSHGDLGASITFTCAKAAQAQFVDVKLFDAYARIRSIDAQIASPQGQFKRSLRPDAARLSLTR